MNLSTFPLRNAGLAMLTTLTLTLTAGSAAAATIHVDADSTSASPSGSAWSPFPTIAAGVAAAAPGDVVSVAPGTYPETLTIDKAIRVEGEEGLAARVEPPVAWSVTTTGAELSNLLFEGAGAGSAVFATRPFVIEDCQIQGFTYGLVTSNVGGSAHILRNRIVGNSYGIILINSGHSTFVNLEQNVIVGTGGGMAVYAYNSRYQAWHNLFARSTFGLYHYLPSSSSLPISYAINNLMVGNAFGVGASSLAPSQLKLYANQIDAPMMSFGVPAADQLLNGSDDCGATAWIAEGLYEHDFEPAGDCVDGGIFGTDPDGSSADVGPYGGPDGGSFWEDIDCEGPYIACPAEIDLGSAGLLVTGEEVSEDEADALRWALEVALMQGTGLLNQLQSTSLSLTDSGCPSAAYGYEEYPFDMGFSSESTSSYSGGCTASTGYAVSGELDINSYTSSMDMWTSDDSTSLSADSWSITHAGPAAPSAITALAVDGTLSGSSYYSEFTGMEYSSSSSVWINLDVTVEPAPPSTGVMSLVLREGDSSLSLSLSSSSYESMAGDSSQGRDSSGTAGTRLDSEPLEADFDLEWSSTASGGCSIEPLSGSVEVVGLDAPGGTETLTASVTYDGASSCDGCGTVIVNGTVVGDVCGSLFP